LIIGLVSDTHDNIHMIDRAVKRLNEERVGLVLHAGDYVSAFTAKHFEPLDAPLVGVYGNNCAERDTLRRVYAEVGAEIRGFFSEVDAGGLLVALLHGHRREDVDRAHGGGYDVIVSGHTHRAAIGKEDDVLVVNPGEVCGYVSGRCTFALLDTVRRIAWLCELC